MDCKRQCNKKKKLSKTLGLVNEKLNGYTIKTAEDDLGEFMKLHGDIEKNIKKADKARSDIINCEGTEYCK